ncbi:MAG TPA: hypothetical protein VK869_14815 [Rubrobacteraceae bacterium]|nr:hypothetical protein [Rubrobacteraceae bacterium]
MTPLLALDIDSTVWDVATPFLDAALEVIGDAPDLETVFTWAHVLESYGEEATARIYDRVLAPERVRTREPYPNAAEVLRYLQTERGIRVHFVTRNLDPETLRPHLSPWLEKHFGSEVGLTITSGDKMSVVRELGAFGLVDDDPETLISVAEGGMWAATKVQPWNRRIVTGRRDLHGFDNWRELPALLPDCVSNL